MCEYINIHTKLINFDTAIQKCFQILALAHVEDPSLKELRYTKDGILLLSVNHKSKL